MSNTQRVVRGTVITLVAQLATQVLRFAGNIVLARFLSEEAFGINAMVFALTTGLWLMSDVGIGASIIRSKREDDDFINTAWTLSVVRGFMLFGLGTLAGPVAAWFYDEPQLTWLLPLCSTMVLLLAAESQAYWVQQRRMVLGATMGIDVLSQVLALAVAIPVAIYTQHVIALALAAVVSAVVKFSLTHLILPGPRMRFRWEKPAIKEVFSFGQWIFLSTLFSFLATRWDVFSLGRLQGFALLGVYGIAGQISGVPSQISMQVTATILTPVLSDAFRGSIDKLRSRLSQARRAYLPAAALLFLGAATTAPAFFLLAYKEGFHAAGPMAQLLMLPAWLTFLQEASSRALLAAGDGRGLALSNAVKVLGTIVATMLGFEVWGFWGFVGGYAVGAFIGTVVVGWRLRKFEVFVLGGDLLATVVFVALGALACGVPVWLEPKVGIHAAWLTLMSCALVCGPLAFIAVKRIVDTRATALAPAAAVES